MWVVAKENRKRNTVRIGNITPFSPYTPCSALRGIRYQYVILYTRSYGYARSIINEHTRHSPVS